MENVLAKAIEINSENDATLQLYESSTVMAKVSVAKTNKLPALITVHWLMNQSNVHLVTCQIMTNNINNNKVT